MQNRRLGDSTVSAVGLGAMPLSMSDQTPDEKSAIEVVHAALDAGVTLIDTADAYAPEADPAPGHNERLVARALASYGGDSSRVLVATKGGHTRTATGGWGLDGRPEYLRAACEASLKALGVEAIGLYQLHRVDPAVPFADQLGALAELRAAGKIRQIGLSNVSLHQLRFALAELGADGVAAVQNQFSPDYRYTLGDLEFCAAHGIAFLPWSPFGRPGLGARGLPEAFPAFAEVGRAHGASAYEVCLAWLLALSPTVIPIPGARRPASVRSSAGAVGLELSEEELTLLNLSSVEPTRR